MTSDGFLLTDEGRTISVQNGSATTAVEAGDLVYAVANDDVLGGTAAAARNQYSIGDIKIKSIVCSDDAYQTILGVAVDDIPVSGYGSIAMEGVFIHAVAENVEAGNCIQAMEGDGTTTPIANKLQLADGGATATYEGFVTKIGRALSGGSADGKYIIWKLAL